MWVAVMGRWGERLPVGAQRPRAVYSAEARKQSRATHDTAHHKAKVATATAPIAGSDCSHGYPAPCAPGVHPPQPPRAGTWQHGRVDLQHTPRTAAHWRSSCSKPARAVPHTALQTANWHGHPKTKAARTEIAPLHTRFGSASQWPYCPRGNRNVWLAPPRAVSQLQAERVVRQPCVVVKKHGATQLLWLAAARWRLLRK